MNKYIVTKNNFKAFYDWAIANGWRDGLEIDRINNDGNYEPSNCRCVTHLKNMNNTRRNRFFNIDGAQMTMHDIAILFRIDEAMLRGRIKTGWEIKRAIEQPKRKEGVCY